MNIYKNFLSKNEFKELEDRVMGDNMPWYFNDSVVLKKDDYFQLVYVFVKPGGEINCEDFIMDLLKPFVKKLNIKKFFKVKANLLTRTNKIIEHGMHIDDDRHTRGKTGIFYLNTCDGYTKLEDGTKIKSEKNKYVEFDCNIKHTGSSCTNKKRRVVINLNY
tara:strand:- start:288 stop:773 length:486 start_codon:yes stop_codon:yes gene_type:complete